MLAVTLILAQASAPAATFQSAYDACRASAGYSCAGEWRGVTYDIERDGKAASFKTAGATWRIGCKVDAMEDTRSCVMTEKNASPYPMMIWASSFPGVSLSIGYYGNSYPGSTSSLRVDASPAASVREDGVFNGVRSAALLSQMRNGTRLRVRAYDWPSNASKDSEIDLARFSAVLDAALVIRRAHGLR